MQAKAIAHPNVALIKYWGKADTAQNLPAVGSLSLTLAGLSTQTSVRFESALVKDEITINGASVDSALPQVERCLSELRQRAGVSKKAFVESINDFPTAAGLASSASGYAALVTAAAAALGLELTVEELANIARLGSGSAARSLYSGIVTLQKSNDGSSQVNCESISAPEDWPLTVLVAITSREHKTIGSTDGMERSKETSPYYQAWIQSHEHDLQHAIDYVGARAFQQLADVSEHSCLKMHAVAQTSQPPLLYWSGITLDLLQKVQELRAQQIPAFFTVDAGPQVKVVCLPEVADRVAQELHQVPGVLEIIRATLGQGARVVQ